MNTRTLHLSKLCFAALGGALLIACGGGGAGVAGLTTTANVSFAPAGDYTGDSSPITGGTSTVEVSGGNTILTLRSGSGRKLKTTLPTTILIENQTFPVMSGGAEIEYTEGDTRSHGGFHWSGITGSIKLVKNGNLVAVTFNNGTSVGVIGGTTTTNTSGTSGNAGTYNTQPVGPNRINLISGATSNVTLGSSDPGETVFTGGGTSNYTATFYVGTEANHTKTFIVSYTPTSTTFTPNSSSSPLESIRYEQIVGFNTLVWEGTGGLITYVPGSPNTISLSNVVMSPVSGGAFGNFTVSGVFQY